MINSKYRMLPIKLGGTVSSRLQCLTLDQGVHIGAFTGYTAEVDLGEGTAPTRYFGWKTKRWQPPPPPPPLHHHLAQGLDPPLQCAVFLEKTFLYLAVSLFSQAYGYLDFPSRGEQKYETIRRGCPQKGYVPFSDFTYIKGYEFHKLKCMKG